MSVYSSLLISSSSEDHTRDSLDSAENILGYHTRICACAACASRHGLSSESSDDSAFSLETQSSESLVSGLISAAFGDHTRAALNGSETLYYYIYDDPGDSVDLGNGVYVDSCGHLSDSIAFIESIFIDLDPLIDLDFERKANKRICFILIFNVKRKSEFVLS